MPLPEHPFERLEAESAALKQLAGGPELSVRELAESLGVGVAEVERAWRGEEPLSLRARRKLADLLGARSAWLVALEREVRRPVLRVDPGTEGKAESGG